VNYKPLPIPVPVCHGLSMTYSDDSMMFRCATLGCSYAEPAYLHWARARAARKEYHTYMAKVAAVRAQIQGEPVPEWAMAALVLDTVAILVRVDEPGPELTTFHFHVNMAKIAADNAHIQGVPMPDWAMAILKNKLHFSLGPA